ncbi:MAG: ABC transporter permease subunit [Actinomycetota bacterium]
MTDTVEDAAPGAGAEPGAGRRVDSADVELPGNDDERLSMSERLRAWSGTIVAVLIILVVWEVAGRTYFEGKATLSPPTRMVASLIDEWPTYPDHIIATLTPAAKGWVAGVGLATLLGVMAVLIPATERATLQFAVATYSLPIIAIGPILQVTFSGDTPRAALAGLAVFFSALISTILGLRSASRASMEVVRALGGGRLAQLVKVQIPAALPTYFNGLRISGPAAILGSVLGEYLGRVSNGLGLYMVNAAFALQPDRTWAIALVLTALAGSAYLAIGLVGRLLTPWAREDG